MINRVTWAGFVSGVVVAACGQGASPSGSPASDTTMKAARHSAPVLGVRDELPEGYVHVPGGKMAHQDCVHQLPEGGTLEAGGNVTIAGKVVAHYEACAHPTFKSAAMPREKVVPMGNPAVGGDIEVAVAWAPALDGMAEWNLMDTGNITVPEAPTSNDGQLIQFGSEISNGESTVMLSLQWGTSSQGGLIGGEGWTYAAWSVDIDQWVHTAGITVHPGDVINGQMGLDEMLDLSGTEYAYWSVGGRDVTTGASTGSGFWVHASAPFDIAYGESLAAYGISQCSDFPSPGIISALPTLYEAGPTWQNVTLVSPTWDTESGTPESEFGFPNCSYSIAANAANGVTITY